MWRKSNEKESFYFIFYDMHFTITDLPVWHFRLMGPVVPRRYAKLLLVRITEMPGGGKATAEGYLGNGYRRLQH